MGTKNSTTTQSNEPSQQALQAYQYVGNVAKEAASLPLQQYQGPRVAGFTPDQQAAFGNIQNAQGIQTPYINAASQYASQGAAPVNYNGYTPEQFSAEGLAQFYNPYQQNVIDSTLANINRNDSIQQNQLLGGAISSGASPFGGDRAGIAAAELARNQGLARNQTIADITSKGFDTALGAYQNQIGQNTQAGLTNAAANLGAGQNNASRAGQAAEQYAGLGTQAQNQALTGASALLQTGNLQQQQNQQQLDIPYQNFLQQQAYPQQQASALINAINGNPVNLGSTTTSTQPSGNTLTSLLGGLTSLAGLFKDGGAVDGFDVGGTPAYSLATPPDGGYGIAIPMLNDNAFRVPSLPQSQQPAPIDWQWTGGTNPTAGIPSYINALPQISPDAMPAPRSYSLPAGLLAAIRALPDFTKDDDRKAGGGISGYASGGAFDFGIEDAPYDAQPLGDITPVNAFGLDTPDQNMASADVPLPPVPETPTLDVAPPDQPVATGDPMGIAAPSAPETQDAMSGIAAIFGGNSEDADAYLASPKAGLLQAGLAMMASKSPFVLQGVGEGALAGLQSYAHSRAAAAELDAHPVVDDSGPTTRVYYPSEKKWVDTGIPSTKYLEMQQKGAPSPIKMSPGDVMATPNPDGSFSTNYVAPGGTSDTASLKEYQKALDQGFKGTFLEFMDKVKRGGADRPHSEDQFGVDRYYDTGEPIFPTVGSPPGLRSVDAPVNGTMPGFTNAAATTVDDPDPVANRQPLFSGKSLQGQVLNQMYVNGNISREEAWAKAISDESYRPLTDPQERAYYGIPADDKTPYVIDTDNHVTPISGGGIKIENNLGPNEINYGDPPKDMVWARDANGKIATQADPATGYQRPVAVPISGGSIERDAADAKSKADAANQQSRMYADIVTQDIDRSVNAINSAPFPVTGLGALTAAIPGTPGYDIAQLIKTVKANVGFDRLQQMRASSPTGGALGQVSDFENQLLQATVGNLEQAQSKDQLIYNLNRVKEIYSKIVNDGIKPGDPLATAAAPTSAPMSYREGAIATNPNTGKQKIFKGGSWMDYTAP